MTAHAPSTARAPQPSRTADLSGARPIYKEFEYDSEAETLVGSESDDDDDAHLASANSQPAAGYGTAGWPSSNEPSAPVQDTIDGTDRAQKAKEVGDAAERSSSAIADARRKQDGGSLATSINDVRCQPDANRVFE